MKDKIIFVALLMTLLVGCSASKNPPSSIPTQEITPFMLPPTWTSTVIATPLFRNTPIVVETFTPVPPLTSSSSTNNAQTLPTQTPTFTTQTLPAQTSTLVDWESLPKLSQVVISSSEIKNNDELAWNPLILSTNTTNELRDSCLWDCVKYGYSLKEGTLTILLLRAGDHQKAENTVESLKNEFLITGGDEYTVDDFWNMPSGSWAFVDAASGTKDSRTGAVGMAYGSIVILVTYSQNFCSYTLEVGRYCEGDVGQLVDMSIYFLNAQIKKLDNAGYPK